MKRLDSFERREVEKMVKRRKFLNFLIILEYFRL